jgi:hypothetical protein
MEAKDRERLVSDALASVRSAGASNFSIRLLGAGYYLVNMPGMRRLIPDNNRFKVEQFERQIVTFFLLSTDYLSNLDRPGERVSYLGLVPGCISPWAKVD